MKKSGIERVIQTIRDRATVPGDLMEYGAAKGLLTCLGCGVVLDFGLDGYCNRPCRRKANGRLKMRPRRLKGKRR